MDIYDELFPSEQRPPAPAQQPQGVADATAVIDKKGQGIEDSSKVTPQPTPAEEPTLGGELYDTFVRGGVGGVSKAVEGAYSGARALLNAPGQALGFGELIPDFYETEAGQALQVEQPRHLQNQIVRDITQFGIGIFGGTKALEGMGLMKNAIPAAKELVGSFIGTGVVADPHEPRLSNLIEKYPFLHNPITEFLQADPDDSVALGKFKAATEDFLTAPVAMILFESVARLSRIRHGKKVDPDAVERVQRMAAEAESGKSVVDDGVTSQLDDALKGADEVSLRPDASTSGADEAAKAADDLWAVPKQEFSSADTSINSGKLPAVFNKIQEWKDGATNLDIGGGRFNNAADYLKSKGVKNYIFDPFNRTADENAAAVAAAANGQSDTVTISNVLNVIKEPENQLKVLQQAENALKPGGKAYITVYEGAKTGAAASTSKGFQQNKKLADYLEIVQQVFPEARVKNGVIVAEKQSGKATARWATKLMPPDMDLHKALPGAETGDFITMMKTKDIQLGHDLQSPNAQASIEKYMKAFQEDPSKVPAMIVEQLPDGTFLSRSGNGRLGAAIRMGYDEVPVVVHRPKDTVSALGSTADLNAKATAGIKEGAEHLKGLKPDQQSIVLDAVRNHPEKGVYLSKGKDGVVRAFLKSAEHDVAVVENAATRQVMFKLSEEDNKAWRAHMEAKLKAGDLDGLFDPLVEKGLFNYKTMTSQQDVKQVMETLSAFMPELNKVQSLATTRRLASFFGKDPQQVAGYMSTWATDAHRLPAMLVAAKEMSQSIAKEVDRLSKAIYYGKGGAESEIELIRMIDTLADIEGMTKTVQKAAARATSAGRIRTTARYTAEDMKKLLQENGGSDNIRKLAERLALAGARGEMDKVAKVALQKGLGRKLIEAHNEFWINSILSGVKTHVVNLTSAAAQTILKPTSLVLGGRLSGDRQAMAQGFAIFKALPNFLSDSWEMAARSLRAERPYLDPGKSTIEGRPGSISAAAFDFNDKNLFGIGLDYLGKTVRIGGRFLTAEDEFMKQINYRAKLMAMYSEEAANLTHAGKLDPKKMVDFPNADGSMGKLNEVDAFIHKRFNSAFVVEDLDLPTTITGKERKLLPGESVTPEGKQLRVTMGTDEEALRYAQEATFTQSLHAATWHGGKTFSEWLQQGANAHPLLRGTVLPFVRVPTNLMRSAIDYGPLAPIRAQFLADIRAGGARAAEAKGRLAVGSMLWASSIAMALQGKITGAGPGDPKLLQDWKDQGWQPYSFIFPNPDGTKRYVSFQRLDPFASFYGIAADFAQTMNSADPNVRDHLAVAMTLSLASNLSSKSYLRGIMEVSTMLSNQYSAADTFQRALNMKAASYVPSWLNAFQSDDQLRHVRTMADAVIGKIPIWSKTLEPRRDYLGEVKVPAMGYPWSAVNPFTVSDEKPDKLRQEMLRLSMSESRAQFNVPPTKLLGLDLVELKNSKGQSAYDRWMELVGTVKRNGKTIKQALTDVMQEDRYKNGTDGDITYPLGSRPNLLHTKAADYYETAKKEMMEEFHNEFLLGKQTFDLKQVMTEIKRSQRAMRHGRDEGVKSLEELLGEKIAP